MADINVTVNQNAMQAINNLLNQKIERVGQYVENKAKENCPVKTGIMRASIHHTTEGNKTTVGTDVEYAVAVHEGHGSYPGKPFLKDAVFNNLGELQNILRG